MTSLLPAFGLGVVSGSRAFTGLAAVSWAVRRGRLPVGGRAGAVLGHPVTAWAASAVAAGELVGDKLPMTPSRTEPLAFAGRVMTGAGCGAAVGSTEGMTATGAVAGGVGAVVGTLGGYHARAALAKAFGRDLPAAVLEDSVAVAAAVSLLWTIRPSGVAGRTKNAAPVSVASIKQQ